MAKILVIAALGAILLASTSHTVAGEVAHTSVNPEEAKVRQFVMEEIERWNTNGPLDADRYTADSDYVDVYGGWMRGLANRKNKRDSLQLKDSRVTLVDLHIRFIRPDVAIAHQTHDMKGKRGQNGEELPIERQLSTRVLVKKEGKWIQTAFQNTIVRPTALPTKK